MYLLLILVAFLNFSFCVTIKHYIACKQVKGTFEELATKYYVSNNQQRTIQFGKIDTDDIPSVEIDYNVTTLPTFVLLNHKNHVLNRFSGSNPIQLTEWIETILQQNRSI